MQCEQNLCRHSVAVAARMSSRQTGQVKRERSVSTGSTVSTDGSRISSSVSPSESEQEPPAAAASAAAAILLASAVFDLLNRDLGRGVTVSRPHEMGIINHGTTHA
jgi:hypothetical protein